MYRICHVDLLLLMLRLAEKPNRVTIDIDFGSGFFFVMIHICLCRLNTPILFDGAAGMQKNPQHHWKQNPQSKMTCDAQRSTRTAGKSPEILQLQK
jgi:hypothetical protein